MKKIAILILAFVCLNSALTAQDNKTSKELAKAKSYLYDLKLDKAISLYKKELSTDPNNIDAQEGLIKAYLLQDDRSEEAFNELSTMYSENKMSDELKLKYAKMLSSENRFDEAKNVYNSLTDTKLYNPLYTSLTSDYFSNIGREKTSVQIRNMSEINSKYSDFSPAIYKDNRLIFVSTSKNKTKTGWGITDGIKNQYTDLFTSEKVNDSLNIFKSPDMFLASPDQRYMEGPVDFANNYGVMYITRSFVKENNSKSLIPSKADNKTINLEICRVNYSGTDVDRWTEFTPLKLNKADDAENSSYAHPAVTNDGQIMYFTSNMPGGFGGSDIWMVQMDGTAWGNPINLGPTINSPGEELFPTLSPDDNTLYYSSDGLPGLGGLDVFSATKTDNGSFSLPQNIGSPINSAFDDFSYVIAPNNTQGYFTSNRPVDGKNMEDDIYSWTTACTDITVKVVAAATKEPIPGALVQLPCYDDRTYTADANGEVNYNLCDLNNCVLTGMADGYVTNSLTIKDLKGQREVILPLAKDYEPKLKMIVHVYDKETNELIPDATVTVKDIALATAITGTTNIRGRVNVGGVESNSRYEVKAAKDDGVIRYLTSSIEVSTTGIIAPDSFYVNLYLLRGAIGKTFRIDNIYYDLDKWNIKPAAAKELDNIVSLMYDNPNMRIEMGSHTDCRASKAYNEKLSQRRAESAVDYLVSKGVSRSRLESHGYGESQLVNNCACEGKVKSHCTEAQHAENRRTEFKILHF